MQGIGELRRAMYVMEMNRHKPQVHQTTKDRQEEEFENAVLALAMEIYNKRRVPNVGGSRINYR